MKVIGFDPAAKKNLGIAIVVLKNKKIKKANAFTQTFPKIEDQERPWLIFQYVDNLIFVEKPDLIVFEKTDLFGGSKYIRSLITKCICIIECCAVKHGVALTSLAPASIKKIVTGSGRATKDEVQSSVKKVVSNCEATSEHAWDALASCLAYLKKEGQWITT